MDLPLVQLLGGSYDIFFNLTPANEPLGADPGVYDALGLSLTPESAINEDLYTPEALQAFADVYAEAIGPYKDSIRPTTTLDTPVDGDGDGDGEAEITRQLAGETTPLVEDAHAAGLEVVPYTLRDEEVFQSVRPDGTVETPGEETRVLVELGVDGFFTDDPDTGRTVVNQALEDRDWEGADWDAIAARVLCDYGVTGSWYIPGVGLGAPDPAEPQDWDALAAQVLTNHEATGSWYL